KNKKPIGLLSLLNIDEDNSKAEMRKMIGDVNYRGKGYAKEATSAWLHFSTEFKKINKIYINTVETNLQNVSINRRLGLQLEGLLKKELIIDNVEHDVLRMAYFKR
ncbi:MAG: GNAT family protein, partial [Melioribacteraceae bacterium]|nr:GNAT family protein [Melioribacteraceae bacterium]